ncbi:phage tail spike protein [Virgibacillus ndiopensis]|uniref:phage tail spike protein n=1 Tax=Virgibacillus ndiopensis TaxID=2004408 RepID=UPI000C06FBFC|nr:phage tail spike protein [Virgibacillus ndiopensis]
MSKPKIIITNKSDNVLTRIPFGQFWNDWHEKSLKDYLETFDFTTFADKKYSRYLEGRNKVIIPDEDGKYIEFIITRPIDYRDPNGVLLTDVNSSASYIDLIKAKVISPQTLNGQTVSQAAGTALSGTKWEPGTIIYNGVRTIQVEEHTNPFSLLKKIASEFDLELHFRVEVDGNKVVRRYVDLLERVGTWRGRHVTFGKDLLGIKRIQDTDNIVTALVGLGPVREDGTRLEVFVEDKDALARWGEDGNHLVDKYEPTITDEEITEERLRELTQNELDKRVKAIMEYESDIADLEHVPGMENKKIRFGDTIKIKETKFNPPLYLEARVHNQGRSLSDKSQKRVILGDYIEYTEDEVKAIWKSLQKQVRNKVSLNELQTYAEPKKIISTVAPNDTDVTWVDTTQTPYVAKVNNANTWVKMTPTIASEVGTYDSDTIDSQNQAIYDDSTYYTDQVSKNASRLTEGVIDVGAIPLRTAESGARIEWDGVNGFVQYDAEGTPVNWMDLLGNFHAENGYFSGDIEAATILGSRFESSIESERPIDGNTIRKDFSDMWIEDSEMNLSMRSDFFTDYAYDYSSSLTAKYAVNGIYLDYSLEGNKQYELSLAANGLKYLGIKGSFGFTPLGSDTYQVYGGKSMLKFHSAIDEIQVRNTDDTAYTNFKAKNIASNGGEIRIDGGAKMVGEDVIVRNVYSKYNTSNRMVADHANGNVSVNAVGGKLYLGLYNTTEIVVDKRIALSGNAAIDSSGGSSRWLQSNDNYIMQNSLGNIFFYIGGTQRHAFFGDGTKSGGSIEIDNKVLGMSPIDSPQVLLSTMIAGINLIATIEKEILMDTNFAKAITKYAVFPNQPVKIRKEKDRFFVTSESDCTCDFMIFGERIGYENTYWMDMGN